MQSGLRGAIVGFGFIAQKGHLAGYRAAKGFEIVAVADTCAARRALARELIAGVRTYASAEALFAAERGAIDFVDIAVPPAEHASIARHALGLGLHVLCEKPLTVNAADAEMLLDTARNARRVIFPAHNYRHAPVIREVRELLDADAIGAVHQVHLQTFRTTHARGVAEWRPDWRREQRWAGGGIAMDHGAHTFYLAFDWLRSHPIAVSATIEHGAGSHGAGSHRESSTNEDTMSCHVQFPTGIAVASMTWRAGVRRTSYTLHGERGSIVVNDDDIEVTRQRNGVSETQRSSVRSDWKDASHPEWFASLFERFAEAIDNGEFVGTEATDALECVRLIEAVYASARAGRRLELPRVDGRLRVTG